MKLMAGLNISVTRKTLQELDKIKAELEDELGMELSYNKTLQFIIKRYKELSKAQ